MINFVRNTIVRKYTAKYGRARLRAMMRGYRMLSKTSNLSELQELKYELTADELHYVTQHASLYLFGASIKNAELIVRQYLHAKLLLGPRFNKAVLYSLGSKKPIRYPLSLKWQSIIKERGYKVNVLPSYLLWLLFIFACFAYGLLRAFKIILISMASRNTELSDSDEKFAYFNNIQLSNMPTKDNDDVENIFSWYSQWDDRDKQVTLLCHSVKNSDEYHLGKYGIKYLPLFNLGSIKLTFVFIGWFILAVLICIKDILLLRWYTPLLLEQFITAAVMRYADEKYLAADYLFHNSTWVYRPIWTYEAEKRRSRILFYFYSTNVEALKTPEGYPSVMNGWDLAAWPHILVWDKHQSDFVLRTLRSVDTVDIVGQIWFSSARVSCEVDATDIRPKKAVIFDVQPHRSSSYQMLGILTEYYSHEVAIQFLMDVFCVLEERDITVLHKRKRNLGKLLHPKYLHTLNSLQDKKLVSVDSDVSANYLINISDIVISMPFTSTALLGRSLGKPSIYYDPFGDIQKDDRGAHGVQIVVGISDLRKWVNSVLTDD